jgi:hypothetical protein
VAARRLPITRRGAPPPARCPSTSSLTRPSTSLRVNTANQPHQIHHRREEHLKFVLRVSLHFEQLVNPLRTHDMLERPTHHARHRAVLRKTLQNCIQGHALSSANGRDGVGLKASHASDPPPSTLAFISPPGRYGSTLHMILRVVRLRPQGNARLRHRPGAPPCWKSATARCCLSVPICRTQGASVHPWRQSGREQLECPTPVLLS